MDQAATYFAGMFGGLSQASWGAIFGALVTAILAYLNSVVTHSGNRGGRRLAIGEKRAILDVRQVATGAGGPFLEGKLVNIGLTYAQRVEIIVGDESVRFAALAAGEERDFKIVIGLGATHQVRITYDDFVGRSHVSVLEVKIGAGGPEVRWNRAGRMWFRGS